MTELLIFSKKTKLLLNKSGHIHVSLKGFHAESESHVELKKTNTQAQPQIYLIRISHGGGLSLPDFKRFHRGL